MGDLRQYGVGSHTGLENVVQQWAGQPPANDYPLFQPNPVKRWNRPVTNPPANDPGMSPQGRLNQFNDAALMDWHRRTIVDHMNLFRRYMLLKKMQGGAEPTNFQEALVAQQGNFEDNISSHGAKLRRSDQLIDEQRYNLQKRYMVSPFERQLAGDEHMPPDLRPSEPTWEEETARVKAMNPMAQPTLGMFGPRYPGEPQEGLHDPENPDKKPPE